MCFLMLCFVPNSFYTCKMHAMKKITLLTYKHLQNCSRGRRVLAMGKVVSEKIILPDLQERQKSLHFIKSRRALFDFCKVPGAQ